MNPGPDTTWSGQRRRPPPVAAAGLGLLLLAASAATLLTHRRGSAGATPVAAPPPARAATTAPATLAGAGPDGAGAVRAALWLLAVFDGPVMYDARSRRRLLRELTDPAQPDLAARLDAGYAAAGASLGLSTDGRSATGALVARTVPVAARLESSAKGRATVAVWTVSLLGVAGPGSRTPVQETWSTDA